MMTTTRMLLISVALALGSTASAFAQSTQPTTRIGVGVSLAPSSDGTIPAFEVPIDISTHLRVQPEFRYEHLHDSETDSMTISARSQTASLDQTSSTTWFGASVLYLQRQEKLAWHAGGKIGLVRTTLEETETSTGSAPISHSATQDGYFVGAVFGGEYFLHDRFSLGVVISGTYQSADVSFPESYSVVTYNTTLKQQRFDTRAALTARVYLK